MTPVTNEPFLPAVQPRHVGCGTVLAFCGSTNYAEYQVAFGP
jgi:hypothetical protein